MINLKMKREIEELGRNINAPYAEIMYNSQVSTSPANQAREETTNGEDFPAGPNNKQNLCIATTSQ